ncbi:DC-STAMP domain containing 2 [Cichlidogyrus casuarinus]|uniref:DC-STAMP domain containing 2 n=1 Tax=Cichlidogyrus casuarinus TaxID=1844966 RepID=A0ABD2PT39_9PLAT
MIISSLGTYKLFPNKSHVSQKSPHEPNSLDFCRMFGIFGDTQESDESYSLKQQIGYIFDESDNPAFFINDKLGRQISLTESLIAFSQQNRNAESNTSPSGSSDNADDSTYASDFDPPTTTESASSSKMTEKDRTLQEQAKKELKRKKSIASKRQKKVAAIFNRYLKPGCLGLMFCGLCRLFSRCFLYRLKEKERPSDKVGLSGVYLQIIRGLFLGLMAGYIMFLILIYSSGDQLDWAIYVACVTISITVLVCIFSSYAFEIVVLCIPKLFSKQIRWACLLVVFITLSSGPVLNMIRNANSLRNSMSCIISQLHSNMDILEQVLRAPFRLVSKAIDKWTEKVNLIKRRIREIIDKMSFNFFKLKNIFKTQSSWLNTVYQSCNDKKEMQNQCYALLNDVRYNCEDAGYGYGCELMKLISESICKDLEIKSLTKVCSSNKETIGKILDTFEKEVDKLDITNETVAFKKMTGEEDLKIELAKTTKQFAVEGQVNRELLDKIKASSKSAVDMIEFLKKLIKYFSVALSLLGCLLLVSDSIMFHVAWRKFSSFQNEYLTEEFMKQEYRAYVSGQPIALPLNRSERWKYCRFSSASISKFERRRASSTFSGLVLIVCTVSSVYYMDYSFCYMLTQIASNFNRGFKVMDRSSVQLGENYNLAHGEDGGGQDGWKNFIYDVRNKGRMMAETMNDLTSLFGPFAKLAFDVDVEICTPIVYWADHNHLWPMWLAIAIAFLTILIEVGSLRAKSRMFYRST